MPFTRIAKMVLLGWTRWPPDLKIDKRSSTRYSFPAGVNRVFFPCWIFIESSFPDYDSQWLAQKFLSIKVLPWQLNKMATFNGHLSSHMTPSLPQAVLSSDEQSRAIMSHLYFLEIANCLDKLHRKKRYVIRYKLSRSFVWNVKPNFLWEISSHHKNIPI